MAIEESDVTDVSLSGSILANLTVSATASLKTVFATSHIRSAHRFATMLVDVEAAHTGWGEHFEEARDYATAAIILSFAAIEAAINEALDDLGIQAELFDLFEHAPKIDAAQAILIHLGKTPMDKSRNPVQSVDLLRRVRNGLVHARGEWSHENGNIAKLSRRIVSAGIPLSPFDSTPSMAFERGIMSAGAAAWAVRTAREYIDAFRRNADLKALKFRI